MLNIEQLRQIHLLRSVTRNVVIKYVYKMQHEKVLIKCTVKDYERYPVHYNFCFIIVYVTLAQEVTAKIQADTPLHYAALNGQP